MSNAIEDINTVAEVAAKKLLVTQLHSAFGLKFLLEQLPLLSLNETVSHDVLKALCLINYQHPVELLPEPTEDDEHYDQRLADVQHKNEEAKKKNEKLQKLQSRVRFEVVDGEIDFAKQNEKCLLMLHNYRELISTAEG